MMMMVIKRSNMADNDDITIFNWVWNSNVYKASKTKNRLETGFQQPKSGLQKTGINIP